MNLSLTDEILVVLLMLNVVSLGIARLPTVITLVAMQGGVLGIVYLLIHEDTFSGVFGGTSLRLLALGAAMIVVKAWVMPRMLYYAFKESHMRGPIEPFIGLTASMLLGAIGTGIMIAASSHLPLPKEHASHLLVPAALSTVFTGFLMLTTRREPLTQVVGYLVLENGIFIFGLLLVHAMPFLVEVGILLDLFVGVFVMGIILHHVDRQFPIPTSDHLRSLKE